MWVLHVYCRSVGEQFAVNYSDLNLQAELPPDSVYPIGELFLFCHYCCVIQVVILESSDDSDSVSSDSDVGEVDNGEDGDGVGGVRVLGWEPSGSHRPLGEWEKHTTVRQMKRFSLSPLLSSICRALVPSCWLRWAMSQGKQNKHVSNCVKHVLIQL